MTPQPDKLFREKLEDFQIKMSPDAWAKVESRLSRPSPLKIWLRIAAAVIFIAAISMFLYHPHPSDQQIDTPVQTNITEPNIPKREEMKTPEIANVNALPEEKKVKKETNNNPVYTAKKPTAVFAEAPITYMNEKEPEPELILVPESQPSSSEIVVAIVDPSEITEKRNGAYSSVYRVYSSKEVNEKYLDKVALAKATSAQKKPSTFRKLLERAYDLKNNQDPFGDLRQKKNEILALNFKSEKRSQNK